MDAGRWGAWGEDGEEDLLLGCAQGFQREVGWDVSPLIFTGGKK